MSCDSMPCVMPHHAMPHSKTQPCHVAASRVMAWHGMLASAVPCALTHNSITRLPPSPHSCTCSRGFAGWGMTRGPDAWLQSVESRYRDAQEEEEQELDLQESRGAGPERCSAGMA